MKKALVIAMIFIFTILAGCGEEPECEYNSDCTTGKCFTAKCVDGQCKKSKISDCCGNGMKEEGENACSCPRDAKEKCEGKVIVKTTDVGNEIESEYLRWTCKNEECVTGIDKDEQREIPLTFDENFGRFKMSFNVNFYKPFDIDNDVLNIQGELRSTSEAFKPPLKINQIKIIGGETLYGSKDVNVQLKEGESFTTRIPIDYVPKDLEKEERLKMKIFYEETYYINKEEGKTKTPPEQEFMKVFDKKLYLVNTGEEK